MTELIIMNLYGTIMPSEGNPAVRKGFFSFLERYKNRSFAVTARKSEKTAENDLRAAGLIGKVKLYGLERMKNVVTYELIPPEYDTDSKRAKYAGEVVTGVRRPEYYMTVPFLRTIIREHKTSREKSVVISDHPWDMYEAEWENVRAIHVPQFKEEADAFSFDSVLMDNLKQTGTFFFQGLLGRVRKIEIV